MIWQGIVIENHRAIAMDYITHHAWWMAGLRLVPPYIRLPARSPPFHCAKSKDGNKRALFRLC
jgi:hypothetical protein